MKGKGIKKEEINFHELPSNVLSLLFSFLDGQTASSISRICKKFRDIIKDQQLWKKIFYSVSKNSQPLYLESADNNNINWKNVYVDYYQYETMKWKLNQVFGEDPSSVNQENVITAVEFDQSGEFLSIGYQCGQVVVFRNTEGDTYKFHTQFESHHPEFDFLTSLEIEEKINMAKWAKNSYGPNSRLLLTTNDKTIKLWKMYEKKHRRTTLNLQKMDTSDHNGPVPIAPVTTTEVVQRKTFANAHAYNIHSISVCSDGELFISADDLRVNLWHLENSSEGFTIVDCKPDNMNELNEVLTGAEFHPLSCSSFVYSTSKGLVNMADMRNRALCDKTIRSFKDKEGKKSFFSDIVGAISDVKWSNDGRYILARDYLKLKIWDVNMESEPVKTYNVHNHIKSKLYELYENDCIFDKFECAFSHNDLHVLTGSYSNNFQIYNASTSKVQHFQAVNPRERRKKKTQTDLPTTEDISFEDKVTHVAWHPKTNLVAIAAGNYIYLYNLTKVPS